jgi:hypothetical protein
MVDSNNNDNDRNMAQILSLCHGVVQRYLAYIQGYGENPEELFPTGISETNAISFQTINGTIHNLKLDLVPKEYLFDINKCNCQPVRDALTTMINNITPMIHYVITNEIMNDPIIVAKLKKPEYFNNPYSPIWAPNTTMFLINPELNNARFMHDNYAKRIGFVWEN